MRTILAVGLLLITCAPVFAQLPPNGSRNTMLLYKNNSLKAAQITTWWKTIGDAQGAATAATRVAFTNSGVRAAQALAQADTEEANADLLQQQATNVEQSADLLCGNGQFFPASAMYGKATALWVEVERSRGRVNSLHEGARFFYESR